MLSDRDAEEIERARREKVGGPIVLKWLDLLLADRRERIQQLEHLRQRLNQAFRYLDGLIRDVQRGPRPASPPSRPAHPSSRPACPACGQGYVQARGTSPNGITYLHAEGRECRPPGSAPPRS